MIERWTIQAADEVLALIERQHNSSVELLLETYHMGFENGWMLTRLNGPLGERAALFAGTSQQVNVYLGTLHDFSPATNAPNRKPPMPEHLTFSLSEAAQAARAIMTHLGA